MVASALGSGAGAWLTLRANLRDNARPTAAAALAVPAMAAPAMAASAALTCPPCAAPAPACDPDAATKPTAQPTRRKLQRGMRKVRGRAALGDRKATDGHPDHVPDHRWWVRLRSSNPYR